MILEWLVVEGWRCFANRLEIGEFSERINVIHGPNGSGKSSLMLALVRGLFDNHSVTGEKIEQLRPWGRDLAPRVTIQFLHNGTRYRIQKQFLRSADSVLERFEDGRFVRLAQGRAADEHARSLFEADVPGRGATDRRHWGLAQILWSPQGQLPFDQVSDNTLQAIRQALGVQLVAAGSSQVETKIREEYERYYTPKGKLRTGAQAAPLAAWEQELEEKQQRRMELQDQLARYEATSQEIRDRTHALQQLDQTLKQLQDSLEHERQRARRYEALEQQRQLKETELRALEAEYGRIDERIRQIHDLENNLNATEQTRRQLDELTPQYGSAVERYQRLVADAQQKLAEIRQRRPLVQAAQREAHSAARFAALKAHEQQLDHRLAQLQRLANDRQQLLQRIENLVAPDEKRFRQIRSAAEQRDRLKLQLDNSVITVRLHPEVPAALDIQKGDIRGKHSAAPGTAVVIRGKPDVVFHVDGLGRIEATGPVSDTSSLEEQWRAVCRAFEELTAPYRTNDLDALQSLAEQRRALEQELRDLNIRLSTLLEGKTLEAWFEDRTQVKQQLQELLAEFPQWQRGDPDADALKRQAETLEREFVEQVESAEQEWQDFQEAFRQAQQTLVGHQQHIRTIEERLTEVRSQLQALRQDGLSDEERRQQLRRVAMQADALRGQLADIQQQLQQFGTDPRPTVAALEQQIGKLADERQSRKQQVDQLYGALEALAPEAPYTALTALEEEIEQLGRRIERERLRAEAFRLLHQTVSQVREETLSSLTGPIEKEAVATLQRIAGSKFQRVTFNESLVPDGIVPQVDNRAIGLDQISGGEQEQLYFAVRMALAHVAFPNERHLVVLDDVFTYTDAVRLARIQTILDEAADRFQVVLLTCHPERYFALKDVKSFDLEKLAATG